MSKTKTQAKDDFKKRLEQAKQEAKKEGLDDTDMQPLLSSVFGIPIEIVKEIAVDPVKRSGTEIRWSD